MKGKRPLLPTQHKAHRSTLFLATLFMPLAIPAFAQMPVQRDAYHHVNEKEKPYDDSDNDRHGNLNAYYLNDRTGDRHKAPIDTLKTNYFHRSSIEGLSLAEAYTSTYASPYQSKVYFDRPQWMWDDFFFTLPYRHLHRTNQKMRFFDTKVPYTSMSYVKNGGADNVEENFHNTFSTNLGKSVNIGGDFDYDYANGYYASSKSKNITYRLFGSYTGNRYEAFVSVGNTNVVNFENGGITDDRYITNPEDFSDGRRAFLPKDIPTKFHTTWNRVSYGGARLNHRYSLGITKVDSVMQKDSMVTVKHFTPVTSFFHDLNYEHGRRHFLSTDRNIPTLYPNPIIPPIQGEQFYPNDELFLTKVSNTVGVEMLEGFHKWAKMGIAAFASFDWKRYRLPVRGEEEVAVRNENTTYVGGRISSKSFKRFEYYLFGEVGIVGQNAGEIKIDGRASTKIPLFKREVDLSLTGSMANTPAPYLLKHHKGTLHAWDNDFAMSQSLRFGGEIAVKEFGSRLYANIETIQRPFYINSENRPAQKGGNFRMLAVGAAQKLNWRAFHWDNELLWQLSSDSEVAPVPAIAVYSNLYIQTLIAKVMTLQIGVDAKFHTAYFAPYYDPTTQFFIPQKETEIGGKIPMMTAYANVHLKRARFFVQYYNVSSLFGRANYFSMPHYPQYPALLRMGIIIDLRN